MLSDINRCLAARQLSIDGLIEAGSSEIISEEEFRQGFDPAIFRNINTPEDYRSL
jgi:molybdopterin-guanine dinucleotide biosynthesis protein A